MHLLVSRILLGWICVVMTLVTIFLVKSDIETDFYRFGPSSSLNVIGIKINTYPKYFILVSYCFINSGIRCLVHNVVQPWIINHVQNSSVVKTKSELPLSYEITAVTTFYQWFDWFVYMNILLSQIDLVLYEIIADVTIALISVNYYYNLKNGDGESASLLSFDTPISSRVIEINALNRI
jgi:hypothetical protein